MLRLEQVENVIDMADISQESRGSCSQMHTIILLSERTIASAAAALSTQSLLTHSHNSLSPLCLDFKKVTVLIALFISFTTTSLQLFCTRFFFFFLAYGVLAIFVVKLKHVYILPVLLYIKFIFLQGKPFFA